MALQLPFFTGSGHEGTQVEKTKRLEEELEQEN
jgi:hypothetical protein